MNPARTQVMPTKTKREDSWILPFARLSQGNLPSKTCEPAYWPCVLLAAVAAPAGLRRGQIASHLVLVHVEHHQFVRSMRAVPFT